MYHGNTTAEERVVTKNTKLPTAKYTTKPVSKMRSREITNCRFKVSSHFHYLIEDTVACMNYTAA